MANVAVQEDLVNEPSIFKPRSKNQTNMTSRQQIGNTAFVFRMPQETKKKGLKRFLFSFKSKIMRKHSIPSLTTGNTWSVSSEDAESVGNRSRTSSWGHMSFGSAALASPKGGIERNNTRIGNLSPTSSLSSSSDAAGGQAPENLQDEAVSLQTTLNEFQKNEHEYQNICDEYEAFVQEQDAEIEKKENKILRLKQMVEMLDSKNAEETQQCEDLRQSLSDCESRCADHERSMRAKDIKVNKRERELQQQKRVYTTLVLQSQAATQKLQETIAAHEAHVENLKTQLVAASKREGLQILQIETLNEELDAVSERYRLDSAKAEEKSQENQRRWNMWEQSC
ncbi:MAG: hypothetical protein SGBAC_013267 [Bacillariaceae sp.]